MSLADILGWLGTLLVLGAFAWVTLTKRADVLFQLANLGGAVLLGVDGLAHGAAPVVGLNAAWAVISLVGLWNLWRHRPVSPADQAWIGGLLDEAFVGIPIIRDKHCPPDKVFLVEGRFVGKGEALRQLSEIGGVSIDPHTWKTTEGDPK